MSERSYDGPPLDGTVQHITEAPYWQDDGDGETVAVLGDEEDGETAFENVPIPGERPDTAGQTTLDDWGWAP